ncbi:MAG TPA: hydroxymethylglutaryl-CoA reductase, degradative, partial [Nitrososphaerales archaeon]
MKSGNYMSNRSSEVSNFYRLSPAERLEFVKTFSGLSDEESTLIQSMSGLKLESANRMIENVIGSIPIPVGVAVNFLINGKDYIVPMAIEEPSVVAAASNAARMARPGGGFCTSNTGPVMIGQIQAIGINDPNGAKMNILASKNEILSKANEQDPILVKVGGGAKDLDVKILNSIVGPMVVTEIHVDCRDAMGANAVNTMAETVAPIIEKITGGKIYLRIISNLATKRLVRSRAVFKKDDIGGEEIIDGIINAYAFALADPYRCTTHNKGVMN